MEVYQEIPRRQLALPDTRTIGQSLSHVKNRVSFRVFPPRLWRRTLSRSPKDTGIGITLWYLFLSTLRRCLDCKHLLRKILQHVTGSKKPAKISGLCDIISKNIYMDKSYSYRLPITISPRETSSGAHWRWFLDTIHLVSKGSEVSLWRISPATISPPDT